MDTPHLPLRTNNTLIQGFESDNANELVSVTRSNNLLTVAGSVSNNVTALAINGQAAALYHDGAYAVAGGVPLAAGLNVFTGVVTVAGVTRTNQLSTELPVTVNLRYDANGNLTGDGLIAYGYDNANELTSVTVTNAWRTQYAYDGLGRRRVRTDYAWLGSAWVPTNGVWYVYDGMTVLQERTTNNVPVVTYTRGVDLSGTMQGAGGIGGLLARTDGNGSTFYHADGNGNVTALVNSSGTVVAKYLYDSFGNTLGTWGSLAAGNTYRYSSKEVDVRSGAYYYGYRYYQPNLQRWLNRDPIGERGGINLYGFVGNGPINKFDAIGLAYGNPVSGPDGPVGPSGPYDFGGGYYPNGNSYSPEPIPPVNGVFAFAGGETPVPGGAGSAMDYEGATFLDYNKNTGITLGSFNCFTSKGALRLGNGTESGFSWNNGWTPTAYVEPVNIQDGHIPSPGLTVGAGNIMTPSGDSPYIYFQVGSGFFWGVGIDR